MSVNSYLSSLNSLLVINDEERSKITTSISALSKRLQTYFGSSISAHFVFGSYTRGTILPRKADEESDIDVMVVFNDSANYSPQTYLNQLKRFVGTYYKSSEVYQSHPTIVLELQHIKFELVPAIKKWWETLCIPSRNNPLGEWIETDPNQFNARLTRVNQQNGNLIKPLIRLVKRWNVVNGYPYPSYLLEKQLSERHYLFDTSIKDYLVTAITGLSCSWVDPQSKKDKVDRAKRIIGNVISYENAGRSDLADSEIKKLIPDFH